MKILVITLWLAHAALGQSLSAITGDVHQSSGGGGGAAPAFVQSSSLFTGASSTSSITSGAANTTTGNGLMVCWASQFGSCSSFNTSGSNVSISDTAGDTFTPIPPNGSNGYVIGVKLDTGGSSVATATWTATGGGCSTVATVSTDTISGGAVTAIHLTGNAVGCSTLPTVSASCTGGGCVAPTAHFTALGVTSGATSCLSCWSALSVTGTASNQVTVALASSTAQFQGVIVHEFSNATSLGASSCASASSGTSLATGAMTTSAAGFLGVVGRVEALTQTWTAGSTGACTGGCTLAPTVSGSNSFMDGEYKALSGSISAQAASMSSGSSGVRNVCAAVFQ